jgi:hypothetical protein
MSTASIFPIRLYSGQAGLCNQLLAFINGIILARRHNVSEVLLSPFLMCIHTGQITDPAKIFDLPVMSASLGMRFISQPIFRIEYGVRGNYRDITATALEKCKTLAGTIDIPINDIIRSKLFGDHIPDVYKHIILVRDGERIYFDDNKPIRVNIKNLSLCHYNDWSGIPFNMHWYDTYPEFDGIFNFIKFHPRLVQMARTITSQLDHTNKINVCHLRVEDDAITHWSKMNNMSPEDFQRRLFDLYRKYVATIPKSEQLIILTYDTNHKLVQEFKLTHTVYTFKHEVVGREVHAILDLLIGSECTGTFIGCHNLELKRGSTFSYFLHKMIVPDATRYFIDLDKISDP